MRGAHTRIRPRELPGAGPSPRAWGSRPHRVTSVGALRSIPTCVGLTDRVHSHRLVEAVHPHVRGAHGAEIADIIHGFGPSPRAWGSPVAAALEWSGSRSIPTCVGLTATPRLAVRAAEVHPHVRGAHVGVGLGKPTRNGPSPRAWGSQKLTCRFTRRYLIVIKGVGSFITQDTLDRFPEI